MKYVMIELETGQKLPFIFPEAINHDIMARHIGRAIGEQLRQHSVALNAGFVAIDECGVAGDSETLKLSSNPTDAGRMMLGHAVAFMPDSLVDMMVKKLEEKRSGS